MNFPALIFVFAVLILDSAHSQQFPPRFPQNVFKIIPENHKNGSLITSFEVTDLDSNTITLGIYDDFTRQSVYLNQTQTNNHRVTGYIYLINPDNFDFDRGHSEVKLAFTATDEQDNEVSGFVTIYVTDVNDNPPVFKRPAYVYDIPENSNRSSIYNASILATDADDAANKQFEYHLKATGQSSDLYEGVFSIDPYDGNLTLKKPLDYEKLSFYQYTIEAVDKGTPPLTGTAEITIKVKDVQDTPPNFQGLPYIFTITENSTWPGEDILAFDGDRGDPRSIEYGMVNDTDECSQLFSINTVSGKLSIKRYLDRDSGTVQKNQGVCRFDLEANEITKQVEPTANSTATTTVTVIVEDIDDNVPTFDKSHYEAYIEEDISSIPLTIVGLTGIGVSDIDQGSNSEFNLEVQYTNGTSFTGMEATPSQVQSKATVLLRLVNDFKFDYESEESIILHVVATEKFNTSLSTTCTVNVTINNTNDNEPEFNQTDFTASIPESKPNGTAVTVITASDEDKGEFGELKYTLKGSKFNIHPYTGEVYTDSDPKDLDRETRDTYYLTVVATDGGGRKTVASLTVTLTDINDNSPEFNFEKVEMSIDENTTTLTPNILVTASDKDIGPNGEVSYKLECPSNLTNNFTINSATGEINVTQPLDYESLESSQNGKIDLIVIAGDNGTNPGPLESNITVAITVHDINDNTPKFHQDNYNTSIPENSKQGKLVASVSASDEDGTNPNNVIRYYIEKGGSDMFRIDGKNGKITVDLNVNFDREHQDQYNVTIIAADIGTPPLTGTTTLTVVITDINDEPPKFGQPSYTATRKENVTVGSIVENCTASDADEDHVLVYDLKTVSATDKDGNSVNISLVENMFGVHPNNGSVFVNSNLDRETANQISLTVAVNDTMCAENCPQISTAMLTVSIDDVNDEPPKFDQDVYETSVSEATPKGTNVINVGATDVDSVGGPPIYTLLSDSYGLLTIKDNSSGTITTSGELDRETHSELNITVVASDGVNNSSCIVIVHVKDVNDNAPEFLPFVDTVEITEGNYTDDNLLIARVNATDADEGDNAVVNYRLEGIHNNFYINETTGDIFAVGDIDREKQPNIGVIELKIIAENNKDDPENLRNKTKLTINVTDINDNHPKFQVSSYSEDVLELSVKPDLHILQVAATDSDNGMNGTAGISYVLEDNTNATRYFYINETTGNIFANSTMVDNVGTFLLNVTAKDGGEPPLQTSVEVFINIIDENNNAPVFDFGLQNNQTEIIYSILECEDSGTILQTVTATDKDVDENGKIAFSFAREPGFDYRIPFTIDRDTGVIRLNGTVSYDETPEYRVKINATDNGSPKKLTKISRPVKIKIKDVNDQPPRFSSNIKTANVKENTENVPVTMVTATDDDEDSVTVYSILPLGKYHGYFDIKETTGWVTIIKALDRESTETVNITVEASDVSLRNETCNNSKGPVAVNDTQVIIITLDDENDSPPEFNSSEFNAGIRKNVKLNTTVFDFVKEKTVLDNDTAVNSVHSFEILGDLDMPESITTAVKERPPPKCKGTERSRAFCLSSNGTVTTNMVFEENMQGTIVVTVVAKDAAGNSTAELNIDIIVDSQVARMLFGGGKGYVESIKNNVTRELSDLTGYIFTPDEVSSYMKDGSVDVTQSVLTFYVKEPKTGRILTAKEVTDLVDTFGTKLLGTRIKYQLVSIEEAFKTPVETVDETFKQIMILVGITVLEALIICILIFVACRSQGKFKRKLKAATVTTKDEKDSSEKKSSIVPGSNVYASMTNPILNKEVPDVTEFDRISDTDSQNSLDSNEVGAGGVAPDYQMTEEKEVVMDMFTEDYYQPDAEVDPLQMVLSMHEMESKKQNGLMEDFGEVEDDNKSDVQFDFDNPGFELETTEV